MLPGTPARATHDYKRNGASTLFAALDAASGKVIGAAPRHRAIEFKEFLQKVDRDVPAELDVHLILDNYGTHRTPAIKRWRWRIRAFSCTSRRPARPRSISSSAGSPS